MTARQALIRNEIRALAPIALAGVVTMGAAALLRSLLHMNATGPGLIAYVVASVALGAAIVGHEMNHRTLGTILVQPVERSSVLAAKYLVAAPLLLVLGLAAGVSGLLDVRPGSGVSPVEIQVVVFALSAGLAPWLTMVTRNAMAGTVGTLSVPLLAAGTLGLFGVFETGSPFWFRVLAWSVVGVSGGAALAGALWFTGRLEDLQGFGQPIDLRFGTRGQTPVAPRASFRRLRQMVAKELRLHQLPLVMAGLYVVASLLAWALPAALFPSFLDPRQAHLTWLYGGSLALLIGAVASAEERQLGTMPWQVIVPVPDWQQFLLKTMVAIGLCVLLAGAVPAALMPTRPVDADSFYFSLPPYLALAAALTMVGLYVSSLSATSVKAFLVSLPVLAGGVVLASLMAVVAVPVAAAVIRALPDSLYGLLPEPQRWSARREEAILIWTLVLLAPGLVALVWRFALGNHAAAEGGSRRVWRQGAVLATYVLAGVLTFSFVAVASVDRGYLGGSITGTVVDQSGRPVPNVAVSYAQMSYTGRGQVPMRTVRRQMTDREGRFRLDVIGEGEGYLLALGGGLVGPGAAEGFAPTFHPGTTRLDVAQPVEVKARRVTRDVTITMVDAPGAVLSGRVLDANGELVRDHFVDVTLRGAGDVMPWVGGATDAAKDGTFSLSGLPPGDYFVVARGPRPTNALESRSMGWAEVRLDGSETGSLDLVVHPGSFVRGRVTFEGVSPRPKPGEVFPSIERDRRTDGVYFQRALGIVHDDWTFEVGPISGAVLLRATARAGWSLKAVRKDGRDVSDEPIPTGLGDDIEGLEIVLTDVAAALEVSILGESTDSRGRVAVAVFPSDPQKWTYPSRQVKFVMSRASSASVAIGDLLPGDYLAVAVSSLRPGEGDSVEFLSAMAPLATPFSVDWGDERSLELTIVR